LIKDQASSAVNHFGDERNLKIKIEMDSKTNLIKMLPIYMFFFFFIFDIYSRMISFFFFYLFDMYLRTICLILTTKLDHRFHRDLFLFFLFLLACNWRYQDKARRHVSTRIDTCYRIVLSITADGCVLRVHPSNARNIISVIGDIRMRSVIMIERLLFLQRL